MSKFSIFSTDSICQIIAEESAFEGVRRIAKVVSGDIELVCGRAPEVISNLGDAKSENLILVGTVGKSALLKELSDSKRIDLSLIDGKREVFMIKSIDEPFADHPEIKKALVIAGSDKRAAIYGLFKISEDCGVSPLVYWGDAFPKPKDSVAVDYTDAFVSKEPSVKYRGFFINDEWPAFGGWCNARFGGFNVNAYEYVFQLLLRLKGNYMWPAMWSSSFSEDGPGIANAELADIYGVVMGASHHEPMCRQGVEWQKVYKNYGDSNSWSFISNREAITEFWRDGLKRNKNFENIITVGMRGENDSLLLGENATLEDNINLLKEVITTQNELIKEIVNPDIKEVPRMLALYNEVENFYYAPNGLKNWEGLDNVILMLCDDNFANLRYLPTESERSHNGGFGMYFHYDYHGASISYEWLNSNRLTKTWEQMTMAYDYGIRDLWIVNLGDIKGLEYPICYFLDLAYDFDKYGSNAVNKVEDYVKNWVKTQYGEWLNDEQLCDVYTIMNGYSKLNNLRTPESMNQRIYAPINFREGERIWNECQHLIDLAGKIYSEAPEKIKPSIFTMVYYPTVASLNFVQMHIEAAWNNYYASHGSLAANKYLDCVKKRVAIDAELKNQFDAVLDGKWIHMMDSAHTGFATWCSEDWRYPLVSEVVPVHFDKSYVSFSGYEPYSIGKFWSSSKPLHNFEFLRPDTEFITINVETGSSMKLEYDIKCNKDWLKFEKTNGRLSVNDPMDTINVECDRSKLSGEEEAEIIVACKFIPLTDGNDDSWDSVDRIPYSSRVKLIVHASKGEYDYPKMTFVETEGYVAMDADRFVSNHTTEDASWVAIDHLSRLDRPALKVLPSTASLLDADGNFTADDIPYVEYSFVTDKEGEWDMELWLSCRNPVAIDAKMRYAYSINGDETKVVSTISETYKARYCREWNKEILDVLRISKTDVKVKNGVNTLKIFGGDPNVIIQKIVLYPKGKMPAKTYTGPKESYFVK